MMTSGTLQRLKRLTNSVNGNPRYSVQIDGKIYTTPTDAGFVYAIHSGMIGKKVSFETAGKTLKDIEVI